MKTKQHIIIAVALLTLLTLNPQLSTAFAQGSLTPPSGPIMATMKSLDQVEARTIVNTDNTPGGSVDSFIISQPGSYYLTTNIVGVSGKNGIEITANNVTLDLNGFAVQGTSSAYNGIFIPNASTNITVRNGTVSGWAFDGVNAASSYANNLVFESLNVSANGQVGIILGGSGVVRNCNCNCGPNSAYSAIIVGDDCTLIGCTASGSVQYGLYAGNDCIVKDCIANINGTGGINAGNNCIVIACNASGNGVAGIDVGSGTVSACTADNNAEDGIDNSGTVTGCTANSNGNDGINSGNDCNVIGCTASENDNDGIYISAGTVSGCYAQSNVLSGIAVVGNGSAVTGNTCIANNTSGSGAGGGIFISGNNNRIEDNQVTGSGNTGIAVASGAGYVNNVIIKNNVSGNGPNNYNAPAGNDLGPVGTASSSTSPWANISH